MWDELQDQMDKLCSDDSSVDETEDLRRSPWLGMEESSDLSTAEVLSEASSSSVIQAISGGTRHLAGDHAASPRIMLEQHQRRKLSKPLPKGSITDVSIEHDPCSSLLTLPDIPEENEPIGRISPQQSYEAQREEAQLFSQFGSPIAIVPQGSFAQHLSARRPQSDPSSSSASAIYASHDVRGVHLETAGHPECQLPMHICSAVHQHQHGVHLQCNVQQNQHTTVGSQLRSSSSPAVVWDTAQLRDVKPVQRAFTPPLVVLDQRIHQPTLVQGPGINLCGSLSPVPDQPRTPPDEKPTDGKFPVSETGRCSHNAFWTRLRGKRRHSYFYCTYCGVGWRQPTREKQRAAEKLQQPPPIQPIYVSVGAPLHFQSLAAGMPQPMASTVQGLPPEHQSFELRRLTPPDLSTVVVPRLHA
eukprot:GGOE01028549.1.p1 GENE.GGOE01028549.1~~GGOE01028549.1.p1  ORF type:complete len:442 (+),score=18.30 GGOE01028549.1:82-1326(+)